uniref:Ion transport domain-containing protein n=1 Tax=Romanomermis culicivorax TaxID=13658 RepID=A0A915HXW0_ROMCU
CGFTLIFNLECLFKIWCLGWKSYAKRALHKFELTLCIGSSLNIIKPFYDKNIFTFFQVFRIVRLTKASPMLEDFVYKIFGPGKKLGSLVFFTMALLLLTSSISLQLFCFVEKLEKFRTLKEALMAMFQIMTQEGWTDVVVETMRACETLAPAIAIYFVAYHLFVTLIVLSLFVAVILDNLEMEEEMKKVKQLKAREQTTSSRTKLPLRLRIFSKFPERPQMVIVKRIGGEFQLPKIRDTFTKIYADNDDEAEDGQEGKKEKGKNAKLLSNRSRLYRTKQRTKMRKIGQIVNRTSITDVLEHSNKTRVLLSDSAGILPTISRFGLSKIYRDGRKFAMK